MGLTMKFRKKNQLFHTFCRKFLYGTADSKVGPIVKVGHNYEYNVIIKYVLLLRVEGHPVYVKKIFNFFHVFTYRFHITETVNCTHKKLDCNVSGEAPAGINKRTSKPLPTICEWKATAEES